MRNSIVLVIMMTACATPGSKTQSSPSAGRASTAAVEDLVRGDRAAALAEVNRALARHPHDPWLLYNKGVALAELGRIDDSLTVLRVAESAFKDSHGKSLAVYRRALTLEFSGRCDEASAEYARYAALVRDTAPVLAEQALAHQRACVKPGPEQLAEREETARLQANVADVARAKAQAESTESVRALVVGNPEVALARAEAGLAMEPQDPWLLYNRGTALAALGRVDESLNTLRRAEHLFSADDLHGRAVATYRRAIALEGAGRCQEEKSELDHYATLVGNQDPQLAQRERAHLRFCQLASQHPVF